LNLAGIARSAAHFKEKAHPPETTMGSQKSSRGDRTPIELFCTGLRTWDAVLRRIFTVKSMQE
jgi:hypothetical protein